MGLEFRSLEVEVVGVELPSVPLPGTKDFEDQPAILQPRPSQQKLDKS